MNTPERITVTVPSDMYGQHPVTVEVDSADFGSAAERVRAACPRHAVPIQLDRAELAIRSAVEAELRARERSSAVIAEVIADSSGSGACRAHVYYEATGRPVPRAADEGGTYQGGGTYPYRAAAAEAEDRARRAATPDRIIRRGYAAADIPPDGAPAEQWHAPLSADAEAQ